MRHILFLMVCGLCCPYLAHAESPRNAPDAAQLESLADRLLGTPSETPAAEVRAVCGTAAWMTLRGRWGELSAKTRAGLALLLQQSRPVQSAQFPSPSGHFLIHYDTTGIHAVSATDLNRNGVPDYVEEVAATADRAWSLEVDGFGFHAPPSDGTLGGGRDQYDIYLQELSRESVYGYTYPEDLTATSSTSYMELDNNYTDSIYGTKGTDALHVTLAHEFFHAVQFGYYSQFDAQWWQEVTATWMEDAAYTEVNDYYQYLSSFFKSPTVYLERFLYQDLHPYGSVVFVHNLYALFGIAPVRTSWEKLAVQKVWSLDAVDASLPGGFAQAFPRFAIWNFFTNSRVRQGYYPEGAAYPLVKFRTLSPKAGQVLSDSGRVDHLGADYIQFKPAGQSGGLSIAMTLASKAQWQVIVLLQQGADVQIMPTDGLQVRIPAWGTYDEIDLIPTCVSLSGTSYAYKITAEVRVDALKPAMAVGDFNRDGYVEFADFFAFVDQYGRAARDAGFDPRYDLNGDGAVGLDDFFIFAAHFGERSG